MSTSIYRRPYFYIIQHINSGKFYAGVRYGKNSNPDQLLKFNGYQTSSDVVKQIILEEGLESFIIRKIRVFETAEEALDYESRFLRKVNAAFNDNFLNRSNNAMNALNTDWEKRKKTCLNHFGVEHTFQSEEVRNKSKQTILEKYGVSHYSQTPEFQEKNKQSFLKNFGCEFPMQSEEIKDRQKQTMLDRYGFENANYVPEFQEKRKQTMIKIFGVECSFQSEEIKEKIKQTILEKYGFENVLQVPEFIEKSKQTCLEKYGFESSNSSPIVKQKQKETLTTLSNRPIVLEIRKYRDKFKLKLGCGWFWKPQEFLDNLLAELKLTYDLECPRQILESEEKLRKIISDLLNQPTIVEITKYRDKFKLKLGQNWYWKSQEILDGILAELKLTYGEISENI